MAASSRALTPLMFQLVIFMGEFLPSAGGVGQPSLRVKDEEAPTNVGATGQSGISVGVVATDRNNPRACWFWVVADNLRLMADNAVEVMREFVG